MQWENDKRQCLRLYLLRVHTRDKSIITETLSSLIFIPVPNEKNSEYAFRKKKSSRKEGAGTAVGVGTDGKGASSKIAEGLSRCHEFAVRHFQ